MDKRKNRSESFSKTAKKTTNQNQEKKESDEEKFEDDFEDEYDSDDVDIEARYVDEDGDDEEMILNTTDKMEVDEATDEKKLPKEKKPKNENYGKDWKPVFDKEMLGPGEKLECDNSAYDMFHSMTTEWPCLSFDVIPDKLGLRRTKYPHTAYFVAGTQADQPQNNKILLLKMSHMNKTNADSDDDDDENDDTEDDDPELDTKAIPHEGGVNRIRCMQQEPHIVSTWSDAGFVALWDISQHLKSLDAPPATKLKPAQPLLKIPGHKTEGFAMDWSTVVAGRLITGDCNRQIFLTDMRENGNFEPNTSAFTGHTDSIEDLQWSPSEETVFASCSVDKTIKIWDIRQKHNSSAFTWEASSSDINVLSWSRKTKYLIVSGGDDGALRVWDLRQLKAKTADGSCVAHFKWHKKPITSVTWDPNDESVFCAASEDDQITIWDLSTERDEDETQYEELVDIPPQLLFVHQNQSDIKEVRYHPQIPGVVTSTASEGFDIFLPNLREEEEESDED